MDWKNGYHRLSTSLDGRKYDDEKAKTELLALLLTDVNKGMLDEIKRCVRYESPIFRCETKDGEEKIKRTSWGC